MRKIIFLTGLAFFLQISVLTAQPKVWTLDECIRYAFENNISLRQSRNSYLSGLEDTQQARASLFPTLSANVNQNVSASPFGGGSSGVYSASYGVNSSVTLFDGGKLINTYKSRQIQNAMDSLEVESGKLDLCANIVQAYMQCLYAEESVRANENTAAVSLAQRDRASELQKAGAISKVDFAQLESQYVSNLYQVTAAKNALQNYQLQLKQLLELDILDEMALAGYEADSTEVMRLIPDKATVYANALDYIPDLQRSRYSTEVAKLSEKSAKALFLPSVNLSAGLGTNNNSMSSAGFGAQIQDNFSGNAGIGISIPILSGRVNRTTLNKARIALDNSRLEEKSVEKAILRQVESTYLDAVSAQSQYIAALEKQKYAEISYDLTREQFNVGRKNTVELITAQNELTAAVQATIQAKYMALLNMKLLDIYQGNI